MKIIKYLFFLLLLLFIGSAIYFGTKDGSYEVQETKQINVHPELVFNKINDLETWKNWSPWKKESPNDIFTTAEKSSGDGASANWDKKEKGNIETTRVIPNAKIGQRLTQKTFGGDLVSKVDWNFEEIQNGTEIIWTIRGEHNLLDKVYLAIKKKNFNKSLYAEMHTALNNLEQEIQEDIKKYSIHVDGITHYSGGYYLFMTSAGRQSEVQNLMKSMMTEISNFMENNHISQAGNPFVLYNELDEESKTVIFSTCFPVRERVITPEKSKIVSGFMEPVSAVKTTLKGHYKNISETYNEAETYLENNGYERDERRKIFEVYTTNPIEIHNPADWITEIYIPVIDQETAEKIVRPQPREESVLGLKRKY